MERVEIEVLLALSEELHFGRTAERLGLSPGRVTQVVQTLERRVGTALFERTSRWVEPTRVGRELAGSLAVAHRDTERAWARAVEAGRGVSGVLRLGFLGVGALEMVMAAMGEFGRRFPECEAELAREAQIDDHLAPLRAGLVDVLATRFSSRRADDVVQGPVLMRMPLVLAVPAGHELAARSEVSPEDLGELGPVPVLMGSTPGDWWEERVPAETPAGRSVPRRRVASSLPILLALVAAGQGVGVLAWAVTRSFARPDVVYVPLRMPPEDWGLAWRADAETARVRAFAGTAESVVERMGGPDAAASRLIERPRPVRPRRRPAHRRPDPVRWGGTGAAA